MNNLTLAQKFNRRALDVNFPDIKEEYEKILEKIESAATDGKFEVEVKLKDERVLAQLQADGFDVYRTSVNDRLTNKIEINWT